MFGLVTVRTPACFFWKRTGWEIDCPMTYWKKRGYFVQIYLWSDEINRGFVEKTSAAIIVLLAFLLSMNALAIYLRNKFETRW